MQPDDLPDPEDLWWSWVALAALHQAVGDKACGFDPASRVLHLEVPDGGWLCLQRSHTSRVALWGRSALADEEPTDPRREAPDWAVSDAVAARSPSFLAWHVHGEWDLSSPDGDEGAAHLLRPLLTVDPRVVSVLRTDPSPDDLRRWTDGPHLVEAVDLVRAMTCQEPSAYGGAVRGRLRDQIHQQMRVAEERDRMLIQRPPSVVQWSRVNGPGLPFAYAVMAVRDELRPAPTNSPMAPLAVRTLTNVLRALHREEATEDGGAWLFARVWSDGSLLSFERAFDSWPSWYQVRHVSQGPSLDDLAWEMDQRHPDWRPAWSTLLLHS